MLAPPFRLDVMTLPIDAEKNVQLGALSSTPLYNIKAVVQATDISPSTLRAWERRYNMCRPRRSESGYRLYSERDVAVIRWLKTQVDAGMAISQAVAWFDKISAEAGGIENAVLPGASGAVTVETPAPRRARRSASVRDFATLQEDLLNALLLHDEHQAEHAISEAFAMYPVEQVGEFLFAPVLVEIGDRWHRDELSVLHEHFATHYIRQRLDTLLRTVANGTDGPLIWVACAPGEWHEIGAILLSIYLRRAGYTVRYLGQNVPLEDLAAEIKRIQPAMLLLSAATVDTAHAIGRLSSLLPESDRGRTIIGYGGQIFNKHPELRNGATGVFLGSSALDAVEMVGALLSENTHRPKHA